MKRGLTEFVFKTHLLQIQKDVRSVLYGGNWSAASLPLLLFFNMSIYQASPTPWITIMRICDQIFEGIPVQIVLKHLVVHNMSEIIIIHFMIDERFDQKCILTINIYSDLFIISINFYERREFSEYLFNWKWTKNGRFLQNNVKLHFIINFMH